MSNDLNARLENAAVEWGLAAERHAAAATKARADVERRIIPGTPPAIADRIKAAAAAEAGQHDALAAGYRHASEQAERGRCSISMAVHRDPEFARYQSLFAEAVVAGRVTS